MNVIQHRAGTCRNQAFYRCDGRVWISQSSSLRMFQERMKQAGGSGCGADRILNQLAVGFANYQCMKESKIKDMEQNVFACLPLLADGVG